MNVWLRFHDERYHLLKMEVPTGQPLMFETITQSLTRWGVEHRGLTWKPKSGKFVTDKNDMTTNFEIVMEEYNG